MTLTEQVILTEPELKQLCKEWQEVLRLQDWDITSLKLVRSSEMKMEDDEPQGEIHWCISLHTATIKILDQIDYKTDLNLPRDMEIDLVHELLHLHASLYDIFEKESAQKLLLERSLNYIAEALVSLKRRTHEKAKEQNFNTGTCHRESGQSNTVKA